jgi:hypothetical protein
MNDQYRYFEQDLPDAQHHCFNTGEPCLVGWTDETGNRFHKWAVVPCACGHGDFETGKWNYAVLLVHGDEGPRWDLELHDDGTFSLSPSILRSGGCNCHYFWKHGKVVRT